MNWLQRFKSMVQSMQKGPEQTPAEVNTNPGGSFVERLRSRATDGVQGQVLSETVVPSAPDAVNTGGGSFVQRLRKSSMSSSLGINV